MIGRFSALSVSKLVNVTSYYNGKAYYYIMVRDLDKLSIDCINIIDTDEANGVEIKVSIDNPTAYLERLEHLDFISNIYVNNRVNNIRNYVEDFNNRKIYTYKSFKCCSYTKTDRVEVLIGNILYKVDTTKLNIYDYLDRAGWKSIFKYIKPTLNIGDVDITPNREQLLYSQKTVVALNKVYENALNEVKAMVKEKYNKVYEDLIEFIRNEIDYNIRSIEIGDQVFEWSYYSNHDLEVNASYKYYPIDVNNANHRGYLSNLSHFRFNFILKKENNDIYRTKNNSITIFDALYGRRWRFRGASTGTILIVPSYQGFSSKYIDGYLNSNYINKSFYIAENKITSLEDFKSKLCEIYEYSKLSKQEQREFFTIAHFFLKDLKKRCIFEDIIHSPNYIKFKKDNAEPKSFNKEITYYNIIFNDHYVASYRNSAPNLEKAIKNFKNRYPKKLYLCGEYNDERLDLIAKLVKGETVVMFGIAKTNNKVLQYLPKNFISIDDFLKTQYNKLVDMATIYHIYHTNYKIMDKIYDKCALTKKLSNFIPTEDKDMIYSFCKYLSKNVDVSRYGINIDESYYNKDIFRAFEIFKHYLGIVEKLEINLGQLGGSINALTAWIGFKNKLFRLNYNTYRQIKQCLNFN